jgi:hypothetical protein
MSRTVSASTGSTSSFIFDLRAALFSFNHPVAKGRCCPVPEPLAGILLHGSDDVLCVFLRLILVKERNDLSHHGVDGFGFVTHGLSDGY